MSSEMNETEKNAAIFYARWFSRTGSGSATTGREAGIMDNTDKQTIISTASPRPWRVEGPFPGQRETKRQHGFREYANVLDRNGIYIAQNLPPGTAALIVEAVNERDRLRDIVRRLCDELESHYYEPQSMDDPSIVREARAAIGEGKP